jgi:hypothetical protein
MQAAFRLDTPMPCTPDDIFELRDGAWFKLEFNGEDVQRQSLSGRWVMPKVTLIPEKDIKHVRPVKVYVKGE